MRRGVRFFPRVIAVIAVITFIAAMRGLASGSEPSEAPAPSDPPGTEPKTEPKSEPKSEPKTEPKTEPKSRRWDLGEALALPEWLDIGGEQRTRYEYFDENFRVGRSGSGEGLFLRTTLYAGVKVDWFRAKVEMIDSRAYDTDDLVLNTTLVNSLDVLQAYVGAGATDVWQDGDAIELTLGRHTMNIGSRRLVARNRFRNTINNFTGVNATWGNEAGDGVRAFYVIPVQRLPTALDQDALMDNEQEFDEERTQVRFYGLHAAKSKLIGPFDGEAYVFGLDEEDGDDLLTRDRNLWTFGTRLLKPSEPGEFDFEFEAAYQTGESRRNSAPTTTEDLDHRAEFVHVSAGYRWDADWDPRLEVLFDYASGDDDPDDDEWNRFDTLYGARRFEFGPTGIFGAFARSNILSPGLRLNLRPHAKVQVMIADRFHYLASDRDAWTTSGLVDPTGDAGDYIGNLAEFRVRWDAHPNLRIETGAAHLFAGSFIEDAPNATTQDDSTYGYVATIVNF